MKIVSVDEMRRLEAAAFAAGISEASLQQRAGQAVAEEVFGLARAGEGVAVCIGHGNNGRDGGVAAGWLLDHGTPVDLVLAPRHAILPDELDGLRAAGATVIASEDQPAVEAVWRRAGVVVDALVGVGARGALREPLASLAARINAARQTHTGMRVVAVDLPSGIDADIGDVPGEAVWADVTVTLGGVKQGLLRFPAAERVGRLIPRAIGLPPGADADLPWNVIQEAELAPLAPARPLDAHKYRFGRVLVVAGSDHFLGAPVLCAGGAARIGSGLVTVGSTRQVRTNVAAHLPEVTFTQSDVSAADGASAARHLEAYLPASDALVLGPGLGRGSTTTAFVAELLRRRAGHGALVVDADGLFALSELPHWWTLLDGDVVLTPHAGELERLMAQPLDAAEPPWARASRLAQTWGCVLLAKGPFTSVAAPDGRVDVWPRANPALATGGTGDVLAGVLGGLLAQGLPAHDAARLAVAVHAIAAERITERRAWRTLLASDLFDELPAALQMLASATRAAENIDAAESRRPTF